MLQDNTTSLNPHHIPIERRTDGNAFIFQMSAYTARALWGKSVETRTVTGKLHSDLTLYFVINDFSQEFQT